MERTTLFPEIVNRWYAPIATQIDNTINDKKEDPKYLFQRMLGTKFSVNLLWETASTSQSIVAADVVAMDSPLPLKKRDSLKRASGEVPKIGMKMFKGEKLMRDIMTMQAQGIGEGEIVKRIFEDLPRVITGIYERLEYMFLLALSKGFFVVPNDENVGTAIQADFGYKDENKFGVSIRWGNPDSKPLTDTENVLTKATDDGVTITTIVLTKKAYNQMRTSQEAKELFAASIGFTGANLITPLPTQFDALIKERFGVSFIVVDRAIRYEKDGKQTVVRPFADNSVVFLTSENVGNVVYGTLVEEANKVANVTYQKVGNYILTKKFSYTDPYREFTASEALAIPVLENVGDIYLLDTQKTVKPDTDEEEGDGKINVFGEELDKADVVAALKKIGAKAANNMLDATVIKVIGTLSDAQKEEFKQILGIA
jgi:hypothetical protein